MTSIQIAAVVSFALGTWFGFTLCACVVVANRRRPTSPPAPSNVQSVTGVYSHGGVAGPSSDPE